MDLRLVRFERVFLCLPPAAGAAKAFLTDSTLAANFSTFSLRSAILELAAALAFSAALAFAAALAFSAALAFAAALAA